MLAACEGVMGGRAAATSLTMAWAAALRGAAGAVGAWWVDTMDS